MNAQHQTPNLGKTSRLTHVALDGTISVYVRKYFRIERERGGFTTLALDTTKAESLLLEHNLSVSDLTRALMAASKHERRCPLFNAGVQRTWTARVVARAEHMLAEQAASIENNQAWDGVDACNHE